MTLGSLMTSGELLLHKVTQGSSLPWFLSASVSHLFESLLFCLQVTEMVENYVEHFSYHICSDFNLTVVETNKISLVMSSGIKGKRSQRTQGVDL